MQQAIAKLNHRAKNISAQSLAQLQIAVGSILISFSAVFVKLTTTPPTIDGFYRMFFGGLVLFIVALIKKQSLWRDIHLFYLILLTGLLFALDLTFWHRSIENIGPGLATVLVNLQVFFLAFAGIVFYGDQFNWKFILALPLALLGMYFLVGYNWHKLSIDYKLGIYQCLIAMSCYTFYIFALRKTCMYKKSLKAIPNLALVSLASALFLGLISFSQHESFAIMSIQNGVWLIAYGIFGQVLGWLLITQGLPHAKISVAGFLLLLQPAMSFVWDILFFQRPTPAIQVTGAIITLLAIYLSTTAKRVEGKKSLE